MNDRVVSGRAFPEDYPPEAHGDQNGVLLDVGHVVYCPEGIIPALVWMGSLKERCDLARKIVLHAVYSGIPVGAVFAERELGVFLAAPALFACDGVSHLVKAGPQIVVGVEHDAGNVIGKGIAELDLVRMHGAIPLHINSVGVWLVRRGDVDLGIEICDMVVCATEHALCAGEQVPHGGQTRSDERSKIQAGHGRVPENAAHSA